MPYSIDLNDVSGVVRVAYSGDVTLAERQQAVVDVCMNYAHLRPLKILVDVSELRMTMSLDQQKVFGEFLASQTDLADARVAVLHNKGGNPNIVVDLVAFNNGYRLAQFHSLTAAAQWLVEGG